MSYRGEKVVLRARTLEDRRQIYRWMDAFGIERDEKEKG